MPFAAKKVNTIPPPTMSTSTLSSRFEITPILSDTFAPPNTTPYGLSGFELNFSRTLTSLEIRLPAQCGNSLASS